MSQKIKQNHWAWILPLYFVEGLPNAIVAFSAILFYSALGLSDARCVELTSALYLPWLLKPLWSPFIDNVFTKRKWTLFCSAMFGVLFLSLAIFANFEAYATHITALLFFALAFCSATFDISSDGFYLLALNSKEQAFFVGIRSAAYRVAMVFAQGAVLFFAGYFGRILESQRLGWSVAYLICAGISLISFFYFLKILPKPESDSPRYFENLRKQLLEFVLSFKEYFCRRGMFLALSYVLFYRFAEAQLGKILPLFFKGEKIDGGLEISVENIGLVYGTNSPIALLLGGILGGILISKTDLKRCIIPMAFALNLPNLLYLILSLTQTENLLHVALCVFIEQFGYGLGFSAYMMFLIKISEGHRKTSFYAISTGLMALGFMLPSFISGRIKETLGFSNFFVYVMLCTVVSFLVSVLGYKALKIIKQDSI